MKRLMMIGCCMLVLVGAGCKSTETTSAILHNQHGRYDLAISTSEEALAKNPNDAEAYFQIGIAYSFLDSSLDVAYDNFMKAAEIEPERIEKVDNNIRSNYARHYNRALPFMKDPNAAMEDLKMAAYELELAVGADPRAAKGYYMLGAAYAMMGEHDASYYAKAIPPLDKCLELASPSDKHYIDALSRAGQVLARSGRAEEAQSRFRRLVEEDPTNYRVIENIGDDLLAEKDWVGAAVFLELAAEARSKIGAEEFNVYYNIAVAYFQQRETRQDALVKAVEYYKKALALQPDEPQTMLNVVKCYYAGEDWVQAAIWGERYVSVSPGDEQGWRFLARIYTELGDRDKARQASSRYEALRGGSK